MKTPLDRTISSVLKKDDNLNILYFGYDHIFEHMISSIGANFYTVKNAAAHNTQYELPSNFTFLPYGMGFVPNRIDIDLLICNSRRQLKTAIETSDRHHIPLVLIDHELPTQSSKRNLRKYINSQISDNVMYVAASDLVLDEWTIDDNKVIPMIPYGFNVSPSIIRNNNVLVVGDYHSSDYGLLDTMLSCDNNAIGIGNNGSHTINKTHLDELANAMNQSRICLVATNESQPPLLQLMAMAHGCVVVTNKTRWTSSIIQDGINGFLFEKQSDIKKIVKVILNNQSVREGDEVSFNAKSIIETNYNFETFKNNWLNKLVDTSKRIYKR